jgi:hypothetical protein
MFRGLRHRSSYVSTIGSSVDGAVAAYLTALTFDQSGGLEPSSQPNRYLALPPLVYQARRRIRCARASVHIDARPPLLKAGPCRLGFLACEFRVRI